MDKLLSIISFLLIVAVNHAALSPQEIYWKSNLPNTPMPSAITSLIPDVYVDEKSTNVGVGKGGVNVNTGPYKGKGGQTGVHVGQGGVHVNTGPYKGRGAGTNVDVGHGVNVHTGPHTRKPPVHVNVSPFNYNYAATQKTDDPNVALFFLESQLRPTTKFNVLFTKTTHNSVPTFAPRRVADSVPFSSAKYPEILRKFSIEPDTEEASSIKATIDECEAPAVTGEKTRCATSLESMVDLSVSVLGTKKVAAMSTRVSREESEAQVYTIVSGGVKRINNNNNNELVACHPKHYVYAVFLCHATNASRAYMVEMAGSDGAKVEALAVCHTNTKEWNPEHVAFKVLKVKPGSVPVCHFVPQDHVVWARTG